MHLHFSSREHRLIWQDPVGNAAPEIQTQMGPPEQSADKTLRLMERKDVSDGTLAELMAQLNEQEKTQMYDELKNRLNAKLPEGQKAIITKNMERLANRIEIKKGMQGDAAALRKMLEESQDAEADPVIFPPAPPQPKPTLFERFQEKPIQTTLKIVAGATGAYLVYRGIKFVFQKIGGWFGNAKAEGEHAAENTAGGAWKKWLIGLGVGAGALFGVHWVKGQIDDMKDAAAKAAEEAVRAAKKAAKETIEDGKEALKDSDIAETIEASAKEVSQRLSAKGLLMMHHQLAKKACIQSDVEREAVGDLLVLDSVRDLPAGDLLSFVSTQKAVENLENSTPEKQKALLFLASVIQEYKEKHPEYFADPTLTLGQCIERLQSVLHTFAQFGTALKGVSITDITSPATLVEKFEEAFDSETSADQLLGDPTMRSQFQKLGLESSEAPFILYCAAPQRAASLITDEISAQASPDEPAEFKDALRKIQAELTNTDTKKFLLLFLHDKTGFSPEIDAYLNHNLRVLDALQLYSYIQACKLGETLPVALLKANPTATFLLQLKMIHILSKRNGLDAQHLKAHLFDNLTNNTNVDLPTETIETLQRMSMMAGEQIVETALDRLSNSWDTLMAWREDSDVVWGGTTMAAGIGAWKTGKFVKNSWDFLTRDIVDIMERRLNNTNPFNRPVSSWFQKSGAEAWNGRMGRRVARQIDRIDDLSSKAGINPHVNKLYHRWMRRGFKQSSYAQFVDEANKLRGGLDATSKSALFELEKSVAGLQTRYGKVLQFRRFGFLRRSWRGMGISQKFLGPIGMALTAKDSLDYLYKGGQEKMQKAIDEEKDPETKEFLQREKDAMERGLLIDGIGITALYTNPPVGAAIITTKLIVDASGVREGIEESRAYTQQTREEIERTSAGNALAQIQLSAPGKLISWKQDVAMTSGIAAMLDGDAFMQETFDDANTTARFEAFAAYFRMNARLLPLHENMLSDEVPADPIEKEQRLTALNKDMLGYYAQSALTYIRRYTDNTFVSVDAQILKRAELYATLSIENWINLKKNNDNGLGKLDWENKEKKIDILIEQRDELYTGEIMDALEEGADHATVLPSYCLESMRHELALCEANLHQVDFSDWGSLLNRTWTSDAEMLLLARSKIAEKLAEAIRVICLARPMQSVTDYRLAVASLKTTLRLNPDTLAKEALTNQYDHHIKQGQNPLLLTPEGMISVIAG